MTVSCKAALSWTVSVFTIFFINDIIDCLSKIHNQVVCKLYADDVKLYTPTELRPTDDNFLFKRMFRLHLSAVFDMAVKNF